MDKKPYKRYSIGFKKQVVREYEAGASASHLRKKYGIAGQSTISGWVKQYGIEGSRYKLMVIQSPEERDQLKVKDARIQLLESTLAQIQIDKMLLESIVEVAGQELGIDLKKSFGPKPSTMPTQKVKR